jgi:hypothetical protein
MKFYFLVIFSILVILFSGCSRDNEEIFLPVAEITMYAPLPNAIIYPGDTVFIDALATSSASLHGYELAIRKSGASNLYFQHYHDHTDTLRIKDKWKNTLTQTGELELWISVILDHEDHRKNKIIPLEVRN